MAAFCMNPPYIHFSGFSLGDSLFGQKKELLIYVGKIITITLEMRLNRDIFAKFKHISERDELFYTITFFVF